MELGLAYSLKVLTFVKSVENLTVFVDGKDFDLFKLGNFNEDFNDLGIVIWSSEVVDKSSSVVVDDAVITGTSTIISSCSNCGFSTGSWCESKFCKLRVEFEWVDDNFFCTTVAIDESEPLL